MAKDKGKSPSEGGQPKIPKIDHAFKERITMRSVRIEEGDPKRGGPWCIKRQGLGGYNRILYQLPVHVPQPGSVLHSRKTG